MLSFDLALGSEDSIMLKGFYGVYEELFSRLDRQEMEAEAAETDQASSREAAPKFGKAILYIRRFMSAEQIYCVLWILGCHLVISTSTLFSYLVLRAQCTDEVWKTVALIRAGSLSLTTFILMMFSDKMV